MLFQDQQKVSTQENVLGYLAKSRWPHCKKNIVGNLKKISNLVALEF